MNGTEIMLALITAGQTITLAMLNQARRSLKSQCGTKKCEQTIATMSNSGLVSGK